MYNAISRQRSAGGASTGAASCFVIGCLGAAGLAVVAVVGGGFAMYSYAKKMVEEYTGTEPIELAEVTLTEADYEELDARVQAFSTAMDEGTATEAFEISDEELNAILMYNEDMKPLGDYLRIEFEQDTAIGTVSIPLDDWGFEGRFLNGRGTFDVFMRNGELFVVPISFTVGDKPIPESIMEGFKGQNMLDDAEQQTQGDFSMGLRELEDKLDGLELQDGKIILVPKSTVAAEVETLPVLESVEP